MIEYRNETAPAENIQAVAGNRILRMELPAWATTTASGIREAFHFRPWRHLGRAASAAGGHRR